MGDPRGTGTTSGTGGCSNLESPGPAVALPSGLAGMDLSALGPWRSNFCDRLGGRPLPQLAGRRINSPAPGCADDRQVTWPGAYQLHRLFSYSASNRTCGAVLWRGRSCLAVRATKRTTSNSAWAVVLVIAAGAVVGFGGFAGLLEWMQMLGCRRRRPPSCFHATLWLALLVFQGFHPEGGPVACPGRSRRTNPHRKLFVIGVLGPFLNVPPPLTMLFLFSGRPPGAGSWASGASALGDRPLAHTSSGLSVLAPGSGHAGHSGLTFEFGTIPA